MNVACCCLLLLTILLYSQQVEARHTQWNKYLDKSSEEFTSHLDPENITVNGHKLPTITKTAPSIGQSNVLNGSKKAVDILEQEDEDTSASGEGLIEAGDPELQTSSSGIDPVTDLNRSQEEKVNQEHASKNNPLHHSRKTQDNLNASVYKKHSITHAEQVRAQTDSVGSSKAMEPKALIDKELSNSSGSHDDEKVVKKDKGLSKVYKKYNLALLGAVPAQTLGYVPLAGPVQPAAYLPVGAGLNNIGTPTSGGLLSQLPFSSPLSTGGSLTTQLSSSSVPEFQGFQTQSQPSLSSYVAGSENGGGEQTENLPSEQQQSIVGQLGTAEQQTPEQTIQQAGGQENQEQQTAYQQADSQQESEGGTVQGGVDAGSLSEALGSSTQQTGETLSFTSQPNSQPLGSLEGLNSQFTGDSRGNSEDNTEGTMESNGNVVNVGGDGGVNRNISPEASQAGYQTAILDDNGNENSVTTNENGAETGAESTENSSEAGSETTTNGSEAATDVASLLGNEPGTESNGYVSYAGDQTSDADNSLGSLEQGSENSLQQVSGTDGAVNMNAVNANDDLSHSSSSSMLPSKLPGVDDATYDIVNMAFNSPTKSPTKGCKGCPPRARCIRRVCIISEDEPLAHILSALSGSEDNTDSLESKVDSCRKCHQFAECVNKRRRTCICRPGYVGDGMICEPTDACLPGCNKHGKCIKGFCVCDHHHYFNGKECAPYKIGRLRPCRPSCLSNCTAACPSKCCKHHSQIQLKGPALHQDDNKDSDHVHKLLHQTETVLDAKESDESGNEFFSIGSVPAKPFTSCPEYCHAKCNVTCPNQCCASFCPKICASHCLPDCPGRCCKFTIPRLQVGNSSLTESSKMQLVKDFVDQFCSDKCKKNCDKSCPPVCCHGKSLFLPIGKSAAVTEQAKEDTSSKSDMNWSRVMKFLDNLYNTYGGLNKSKDIVQGFQKPSLNKPAVLTSHDSKILNTKPLATPTVGQPQPVVISDDTPSKAALAPSVSRPKPVVLQDNHPDHHPVLTHNGPQLKPVVLQDNHPDHHPVLTPNVSRPKPVVLQDNHPDHHPVLTHNGPQLKPVVLQDNHPDIHPVLTPNVSRPKPELLQSNHPVLAPTQNPALRINQNDPNKLFCPPICKSHCLRECHISCCVPRAPKPPQPGALQPQATNFKDGYGVSIPPLPGPGYIAVAHTPFAGSSGPPAARIPFVRLATPPIPRPLLTNIPQVSQSSTAPMQSMLDTDRAPLCPADCPQECYPGCTYRCCAAGQAYQKSIYHVPVLKEQGLNVIRPLKGATCPNGCSRSCYPNCDTSCCQVNARHGLEKQANPQPSGEYSIKVPCTSMCRPYNCLAYCHHDCCLRPGLKRSMLDAMYKATSPVKPTAAQVKAHIAKINNLINVAHQSSVHSNTLASKGKSSKRKSIERQ